MALERHALHRGGVEGAEDRAADPRRFFLAAPGWDRLLDDGRARRVEGDRLLPKLNSARRHEQGAQRETESLGTVHDVRASLYRRSGRGNPDARVREAKDSGPL